MTKWAAEHMCGVVRVWLRWHRHPRHSHPTVRVGHRLGRGARSTRGCDSARQHGRVERDWSAGAHKFVTFFFVRVRLPLLVPWHHIVFCSSEGSTWTHVSHIPTQNKNDFVYLFLKVRLSLQLILRDQLLPPLACPTRAFSLLESRPLPTKAMSMRSISPPSTLLPRRRCTWYYLYTRIY